MNKILNFKNKQNHLNSMEKPNTIKKYLVIMIMFLSVLSFGYSADHYITSCGSVTFVSGDTYYINLTNPVITTGSSCIIGNPSNVNIIQLNDKITIDVTGSYNFFARTANSIDSNYYNLNIEFTNKDNTKTIFNSQVYNFNNNNFYDMTIKNIDYFVRVSRTTSGTSTINDNQFHNTFIINADLFITINAPIANPREMDRNIFNESVFLVNGYLLEPESTQEASRNNKMYDSVSINMMYDVTSTLVVANDAFDSIVGFKLFADSNDDNIADTNYLHIDGDVRTSKMYIDKFGFRWVQDYEESEPFTNPINTNIVPVSKFSPIIGSPTTYEIPSGSILDSSIPITSVFNNFQGIYLNNGGIDCGLLDEGTQCNFQDSFSGILAVKNRGLIFLNSNTFVNNIYFTKFGTTNNAQMISNLADIQYNNITITNNDFFKSDDRELLGTDLGNFFIQLRANNINMNNNIFTLDESVNTNVYYEVLDIEATIPSSNKITLNYFNSTIPTPSSDNEIFSNNCDALLYNNYLDNDIVVSNGCTGGLNVSPLVPYEHTNNKIYYFKIGNYYADNVGCVDGDSNGICDSSYTSGTITDIKPLSSYPFVYTSHLLTADLVVDSTDFNITLINIIDNQTIEIAGASTIVAFEFLHDSLFPDLTCYFVIDGVLIDSVSNPVNDTIYSTLVTGWTEKNYTYRVECGNEITYKVSDEVIFEITFTGTEPPVEPPDVDGVDIGDLSGGFDFGNLYSSDPLESADEISSFFKIMTTPFGVLMIIGFIFIFIMVILLLFAVVGVWIK